jgi:cell wall-associated NlpC family hydrolase
VLLVGILSGACSSSTEKTMDRLSLQLSELKKEYAPDRRVEWWHFSMSVEEGVVVLSGEVSNQKAYEALVENLKAGFPEVKLDLHLLPEEGGGGMVNGLVNNSVIHLRREPSSKTELITQARLGAPVRILKEEGSKSLIQIPDGYIGYVNTAELHPLDPESLAVYRSAEKVIFTAQYGSSYSEADEDSMPVSDLVTGNILVKVAEVAGFTQVQYPDGRLGWVRSTTLVPANEVFNKVPLKENLVRTALKFNGIPYLWGGTSSKNIDCSGLISNVYFLNGIQLPRDADMQALIGRELHTEYISEGLEPGDLLFFGRKAEEGREESVTHVAMYIGEGEYIHSAGYRERVSINSMDSTQENYIAHYPEIFVRSVRILGEEPEGFGPVSENTLYQQIIAPSK